MTLSASDLVTMARERKCILCHIVYSSKKVIIEEGESEAFMTDHFFRDIMWNL